MGGHVEFRVLGEIEVRVDGEQLAISAPKLKAMLAALLLRANRPVGVAELSELLWSGEPPADARGALQTYAMRLRRLLSGAAGRPLLHTRDGGYLLEVEPGALDLERFESLTASAGTLREALSLWRGPALGHVGSDRLDREAAALNERRIAVTEQAIAVDLEAGRHADVIPELQALASAHPWRERLWELLMLALYRSGRQADALAAFQSFRGRLTDELGVEPGERLRELHRAVLNQEIAVAPPPPGRNHLPRDLPDFTGREAELAELVRLSKVGDADAPVVVAIDGMAGVGKTTIAVRLAHRVAHRYPDAQLFVDLRAYTAGGDPADPGAVLEVLLHAFGVSGDNLAVGTAGRAAQWRAELTGRRVLIVLDNARDAAQVEPLLPGVPGCLVIVTSRRQLVDLDGSLPFSLGLPGHDDAVALFVRVAGRAAGDDAVADVVRACGGLPLALRLVAARLRHRPGWTVGHLARLLGEAGQRLGVLVAHERSVGAVFELSTRELTAPQRRMFRLLGLHPGVDVDAHAAAALAGAGLADARRLLEELAEVNLLGEREPHRYRMHDLLREYSQQLSAAEDTVAERRHALSSLLGYYALVGEQAGFRIGQLRHYPPGEVFAVPQLDTAALASSWLHTEQPNLLACIGLAAEMGEAGPAVRLGRAVSGQTGAGHLDEVMAAHRAALGAATQAGDTTGMAAMHTSLGIDQSLRGDLLEARVHFEEALGLRRTLGDRGREAGALNNLAVLAMRTGDYPAAEAFLQQSMGIHVDLGEFEKTVLVLGNLASLAQLRGEHEEALRHVAKALELGVYVAPTEYGELMGNRAAALVGLGRHEEAIADANRAADLLRQRGGGSNHAEASNIVGNALRGLGRPAEALAQHRQGLTLLREAGGDPFVETRMRLDLATTLDALGRPDEARQERRRALALATRNGMRRLEALALQGIEATPVR